MRAVAKTLMIIFAVVEVVLGLKRTVTITDREEIRYTFRQKKIRSWECWILFWQCR